MVLTTLFLVTALGNTLAPAQAAPPPTVAGRVRDAQRQPWPGATVRLLRLPDSTTVAGTHTDAGGRYAFAQAAAGRYCVRATALGNSACAPSGGV